MNKHDRNRIQKRFQPSKARSDFGNNRGVNKDPAQAGRILKICERPVEPLRIFINNVDQDIGIYKYHGS